MQQRRSAGFFYEGVLEFVPVLSVCPTDNFVTRSDPTDLFLKCEIAEGLQNLVQVYRFVSSSE